MIAMIDSVVVPRVGLLKAAARYFRKNTGITVRETAALGAPVLHITAEIEKDIKPRTLNRRLSAVCRELKRADITHVCYSVSFSYREFFLDNGFSAPDLTRLYEILASKAAALLPCENEKTAYFAALRMNKEAKETITALCGRFRYVLADVKKPGGEEFFREIRRSLGISVVENPTPGQISKADAAVIFNTGTPTETVSLSENCVVYSADKVALQGKLCKKLVTDVDIILPKDKETLIIAGFPKPPQIANALTYMTIMPGTLELRAVTVSELGCN